MLPGTLYHPAVGSNWTPGDFAVHTTGDTSSNTDCMKTRLYPPKSGILRRFDYTSWVHRIERVCCTHDAWAEALRRPRKLVKTALMRFSR